MDENQMFALIEKMYAEIQQGFKGINDRLDNVEEEVKKLGAKIDGPINDKLKALFDGYKQNSEQLNRIEQEVSKHEEFILRRIK